VLNEKLWADSHPDITMDYGYINIFKVIPKNRLTVYSYDSTGILENLSLNLPTVCFWYEGLDDLLLDAIPYYELLIDAKIVHLSPESAAEHIRKYWNNIDEWWGSESVQSVRSIFCKKYARKVDDPVHSLKELLLQD
jgi:putative transferase (TIGR04331 family)